MHNDSSSSDEDKPSTNSENIVFIFLISIASCMCIALTALFVTMFRSMRIAEDHLPKRRYVHGLRRHEPNHIPLQAHSSRRIRHNSDPTQLPAQVTLQYPAFLPSGWKKELVPSSTEFQV